MYQEQATRIEGNIPIDLEVNDGDNFLFISQDQRAHTHGLHKYPAKFFPELPRWFIEKYSEMGDVVLDPFMGSGTTNLEAMLLGRHSVGVDVDPFSRMLSRAKTTRLPEATLNRAWRDLKPRIESYQEPNTLQGVPEFPYRDQWFEAFMLKELAHIKTEILKTDTTQNVKRFFLVLFSGTIRASSNADNNCTRTVIRRKLEKKITRGMAIKRFIRQAEYQIPNMIALSEMDIDCDVKIPDRCDARHMPLVADDSIDLAVTSPPYVNAVDYPRTHQLEMYWLGLAEGSLRDLKTEHVGTEVVRASDYADIQLVDSPAADKAIHQIYETDPRRAYIASKYLIDMFDNIREVRRTLKSGGRYVIIVGNNSIRGTQFENWRYLRDKAPDLGFSVECCFISKIINHFIKVPRKEQISHDHILVLRNDQR